MCNASPCTKLKSCLVFPPPSIQSTFFFSMKDEIWLQNFAFDILNCSTRAKWRKIVWKTYLKSAMMSPQLGQCWMEWKNPQWPLKSSTSVNWAWCLFKMLQLLLTEISPNGLEGETGRVSSEPSPLFCMTTRGRQKRKSSNNKTPTKTFHLEFYRVLWLPDKEVFFSDVLPLKT